MRNIEYLTTMEIFVMITMDKLEKAEIEIYRNGRKLTLDEFILYREEMRYVLGLEKAESCYDFINAETGEVIAQFTEMPIHRFYDDRIKHTRTVNDDLCDYCCYDVAEYCESADLSEVEIDEYLYYFCLFSSAEINRNAILK